MISLLNVEESRGPGASGRQAQPVGIHRVRGDMHVTSHNYKQSFKRPSHDNRTIDIVNGEKHKMKVFLTGS